MNEELISNRGRFIFINGKDWFRCHDVDEARTFVRVVISYIGEIESQF